MEKDLHGKTVAFLGDSITAGACVEPEECFVRVFGRLSGANALNFGIGGTRIAPQHGTSANREFDKYFASRVGEIPADADCVVVFGGTNDFGHGDAPLGELSDTTEETFCGAFRLLLRKLAKRCPHSRLVVLTPLHRRSENGTINEIGLPRRLLVEYVDAMIAICAEEHVECVDGFRTSGLVAAETNEAEKYFADGLHPNALGHRILADMLYNYIKK